MPRSGARWSRDKLLAIKRDRTIGRLGTARSPKVVSSIDRRAAARIRFFNVEQSEIFGAASAHIRATSPAADVYCPLVAPRGFDGENRRTMGNGRLFMSSLTRATMCACRISTPNSCPITSATSNRVYTAVCRDDVTRRKSSAQPSTV